MRIVAAASPRLNDLLDRGAFRDDLAFRLNVLMLEMPPLPGWFAGRDAIRAFFAAQVLIKPGMFRLVPTAANGQPAFAAYQRDAGGVFRAHAVLVLALSPTGIARVDIFLEPGLFGRFGLPEAAG